MRVPVRSIRLAILALGAMTLAACGFFTADPATLSLGTLTPALDATDVPIDTAITAVAGEDLDPTTVTVTNVQLLKEGEVVEADVLSDGDTLTITPAATLDFGTSYTVRATAALAGASGATLGTDLEWTFTTRALQVTVASNGNPIANASVLLEDVPVGTTGADGSLAYAGPSGGSGTFTAAKKFFVPPAGQAVDLDGSVYEVSVPVDPYVFVGDMGQTQMQSPALLRLAAVDAPSVEWDEVTAIPYGQDSHNLTGPIHVTVDYENGFIY
ncbi:MAG: Ig-like domain-containing protein, partial [Spirochaetota bacterium]